MPGVRSLEPLGEAAGGRGGGTTPPGRCLGMSAARPNWRSVALSSKEKEVA